MFPREQAKKISEQKGWHMWVYVEPRHPDAREMYGLVLIQDHCSRFATYLYVKSTCSFVLPDFYDTMQEAMDDLMARQSNMY